MAVIDYTVVETAIGRPISDSDEQNQVEQWIADVEMLIAARLGVVSALDQTLLAYVEREAVVARMRYREDRNSQRSTASDDDTDTGYEHYFLRVLAPWWALLSPDSPQDDGAYSVRPSFDADTAMWPAMRGQLSGYTDAQCWDRPT